MACDVEGPAGVGGAAVHDPVQPGAVVEALALEHRGGGADAGACAFACAAHPHGVDEGEAGPGLPGFAEVQLVAVCLLRGVVGHDLVADQDHGRRPRAGAGDEGLQRGMGVVTPGEKEAGEHDGGVALGVRVQLRDVFKGDGREEADGEGRAIAADHADGEEFEGGVGGIDDRAEADVAAVLLDGVGDSGWGGRVEVEAFELVETLDQGRGVEITDGDDSDWTHVVAE